MKITKFFLMAALALTFAACSNDDNDFRNSPQPAKAEGITITATLAPKADAAAMRALSEDDNTIVASWAEGEKIAILYEKGGTKYVADAEIKSVDQSGAATIEFSVESGTVDGTECKIVYPYSAAKDDKSDVKDAATLLASQDGELTANLDVRVGAGKIQTTTPGLDVTTQPAAQFAIFKFTVKNSDASATIDVKPLTITIGTQDYVITPSSATSELFAALPPVSGKTVSFSATGSDSKTYTFSKDGVTFAAGNYYQSTLKIKPDLLAGVFSVSDSKKVKFSKGNLRYASGTWSFFNNQYDYYTNYSADAWDKFGWSTSATTYGMNTSKTYGTYSGDFVDWGATMGTGWFTLSSAEWTYLFNTRSASTVGGTENGRYAKAKVNDVQGVILFPDTYTHPDGVTAPTGVNATGDTGWNGNSYTVADWTKMESAGCVFLPAAGYRSGSTVYNPGTFGYFWSATPSGTDSAKYVFFKSDDLAPANYDFLCFACSVRLVK